MVPPPQAVMPRPNANDANKAIDHRPIKLNFMRFLHPRPGVAMMACSNRETCIRGSTKPRSDCRRYSDFTPIFAAVISITRLVSDMVSTRHRRFGEQKKASDQSPRPFLFAVRQATRYGSPRLPASLAGQPCSQTPCRTHRSSAPNHWPATVPGYADRSSRAPAPTARSRSGTRPAQRR